MFQLEKMMILLLLVLFLLGKELENKHIKQINTEFPKSKYPSEFPKIIEFPIQ